MASHPSDTQPSGGEETRTQFVAEQEGYSKGLTTRQINMIAIGSSIGTGLFLGAGGGLAAAGPALFILYAVAGFFGYLILRQLGELVMHRPSSGSFVSYTREFYGEKSAYFVGWMYWLSWASTTVVDATAMAIYVKWFGQYSQFIADLPQWVIAAVVLVVVMATNLISVKLFGEMEFWFAVVKVSALVVFLIVGICFVIFGTPTGAPTGFSLISENGGILPNGLLPALVVSQGVVFAYSGIELVGITAGETKEPRKTIPKAINTVILRIALFYVGSIFLLTLLLPYTAYSADESPFVTFFDSIGIQGIAPIMQLVVITAALSSLNAGLYSTGRIVHSMAMAGSAPRFTGKMTRSGVPAGGILLTVGVGALGVILNYYVPEDAFSIVLNISAIGILVGWAAITLPHQKFVRLARQGHFERPAYRAPFAPWTNWLTMAFLVGVLVLVAFDYPLGTLTVASMALVVPILIVGWFLVRKRVRAIAAEREGYTGAFPVVVGPPSAESERRRAARRTERPGDADR
ncbi:MULTISPECIES: amino acid permease [Kocuria]|uniref:amino acid permease n=1 Tax=Kocuria TaxID=57493 RepID=UPI0021A4EA26|nr:MULTISPECIES: amino acid permease [Kocuria]MCT1544683.1 amino acid permease [Kocuria rhizophila]MCT2171296.1 amino acid permease [Kocuria rhizophila]MDN3463083.1 amino acid permease [Kocuria sp. APC 4018]